MNRLLRIVPTVEDAIYIGALVGLLAAAAGLVFGFIAGRYL